MVLVGDEAHALSAEGWDFVLSHRELVFARATPEQKLLLVKEAAKRGERVGVTGDGVNDSPALRNADVGIAMSSGSSIARDAADMVLLTDDFAAIVQGVCEGRLIFDNLRKVIAYLASAGSWSELLPVMATFFLGMPQPLTSFLMIIICCVTDVFAAIALIYEPPERGTMARPPRDPRRARLVDARLFLYSYMFYANLMSAAAFANYFFFMAARGPTRQSASLPAGFAPSQLLFAWEWGLGGGAFAEDQLAAANAGASVFFVTLVVCQMGHLLSIRTQEPYFEAALRTSAPLAERVRAAAAQVRVVPRVAAAWLGTLVTALLLTATPAIQRVCGTGAVPAANWGCAFAASAVIFCIAEARKWVVVLRPDSWIARLAW